MDGPNLSPSSSSDSLHLHNEKELSEDLFAHDALRTPSRTSSVNVPFSSRSRRKKFLDKGAPLVVKGIFMFANAIASVTFIGIIGLSLFFFFANVSSLLGLSVKLVNLFLGLLGLVSCIVGVSGILKENRVAVICYSAAFLIFLLLEVSFIIYAVSGKERISQTVELKWDQGTEEARNSIQQRFECCGFRNATDSPGSNCQPEWTDGCAKVVQQELGEDVTILVGLVASLELICLSLTAYLLYHLPTKKQLETMELEEAWMRTMGREPETLGTF